MIRISFIITKSFELCLFKQWTMALLSQMNMIFLFVQCFPNKNTAKEIGYSSRILMWWWRIFSGKEPNVQDDWWVQPNPFEPAESVWSCRVVEVINWSPVKSVQPLFLSRNECQSFKSALHSFVNLTKCNGLEWPFVALYNLRRKQRPGLMTLQSSNGLEWIVISVRILLYNTCTLIQVISDDLICLVAALPLMCMCQEEYHGLPHKLKVGLFCHF